MKLSLLLPALVGICTVVQGGLNKELSQQWGLSWALVVTSVIVIVLSFLLQWMGFFPGSFSFSGWKWWYLLPGLAGFLIILCIPLSISYIGALPTFLIIIASQIVASGLWDRFMEGIPFNWTRVVGAALAFVGVWIASWR